MSASLPISQVTVMEDRAQVTREGPLTLTSGVQRFEIAGFSPLAVDRSLKVEVRGATFVDARVVRRWHEKPPRPGAEATDATRKLHDVQQARTALDDAMARLNLKAEVLAGGRRDVLRGIAQGVGAGQANESQWQQQLEALSEAQRALDVSIAATQRDLVENQRQHQSLASVIAASQQPTREFECLLVLTLEGSGQAQVRASYLVPCAVWRPTYRATLTEQPSPRVLVEADAMVWQRTGEAWADVQLQLSTARPTLGLTPATLTEDRLRTRPKSEAEKRTVEVEFREEEIQSAGERTPTSSGQLPGLDDGGEARLLKASHRATVPSDGQPYRVPLFSFETEARVERVCTAPLSSLVNTVARCTNAGPDVLLAGPVDLIRQSGFIGRAQLKFTAPKETLALPFGPDDGLRVVRTVEEKHDESVLTGKRKTTTTVTLAVSNAGRTAGPLVIEERLPVSEVKEVEVQVLTRLCTPAPANISKDGIARLEVQAAPNATQTLTFAWELTRGARVVG